MQTVTQLQYGTTTSAAFPFAARLPAAIFRFCQATAATAEFLVLAHGPALANPHRSADQPVVIHQTLHDAVAAAWERLPQRADFTAQQATTSARYTAGSAFVPNAPTAIGSHINDRIAGSNYNYVTSQIGLSTPVWLPGEGSATQNVAQADAASITASTEAAHLALAAQVVDLVRQATLAANARDVAARRLSASKALAGDLAKRFQLGESSQSDSLSASADAASATMALEADEAQLTVARLALAAVTGANTVPQLDKPGFRPAGDLLAAHPRIVAAEQSLEAARANARLVRIADRDDPELGLQAINEKQPGTRWDTRVGVQMTFHFATEARNAPRRAAAEQLITQAEVQRALARREVMLAINQNQAVLSGAERSSMAASRAATELEKRRGQIERAWRVGEMSLIEVVRANTIAFDAAYARDKAQTELASARQRLRLAEGILP